MLQDLPLPNSGIDTYIPKPSPVSSRSPACNRPSTPDNVHEPDFGQEQLPSTPESVAADDRSSLLPTLHDAISTAPPIKLVKKTWAKPHTLEINKLRLKEPKGIPDSTESSTSKWTGTLKRVGDIYNYTPLPRNQIRLLVLKPGSFNDDVYVSIIAVDDALAGGEDWPYCALSYHWGGGDSNNTIFVQEDAASRSLRTVEDVVDAKRPKKSKIRANLYEALKNLRDENLDVSLWVDALCINQFDEDEKNEQVCKMAQIYSKAYNVSIWLGSDHAEIDSPVSDSAMTFIPKVINPNLHARLLNEECFIKSWANLFELLRWSW
ncbi:heterokaryon incompatibility protein-domain-containing protein [Phaeosphaeria sp. MPI-PUGE-AT-0046c]|nr:heterokaryon incompatibility protein-domain-containing protein [Phaeosphaeria sp. MPI-PUGE-AT-0046c]